MLRVAILLCLGVVAMGQDMSNQGVMTFLKKNQAKIVKIHDTMLHDIGELQNRYYHIKAGDVAQRAIALREVPNFWKDSFLAHTEAEQLFSDIDIQLLSHVTDVEVELLKPDVVDSPVRLWVRLSDNPFIATRAIWRVYAPNEDYDGALHSKVTWLNKELIPTSIFFGYFSELRDMAAQTIPAMVIQEMWKNPLTFYDHHLEMENMKNLKGDTSINAELNEDL